MALQFALRPRLSLSPPAPRRRLLRLRLPRLALPVAAYWLAMAGLTHALVRMTSEDSAEGNLEVAAMPRHSEDIDAPASELLPPSSELLLPSSETLPLPSEAIPSEALPPPSETLPAPTEMLPPPRETLPPPSAPAMARFAEQTFVSEPERQPRVTPAAPPSKRSEISPAPLLREPVVDESPSTSLPSCESAAASANETMDLRARAAPDLTRDAFASVLENGAYLARCAIPSRTALDICAAVQDGKVVGVSVTSDPRNPAINACVRRSVAALRFPQNARLEVTRTRFEARR